MQLCNTNISHFVRSLLPFRQDEKHRRLTPAQALSLALMSSDASGESYHPVKFVSNEELANAVRPVSSRVQSARCLDHLNQRQRERMTWRGTNGQLTQIRQVTRIVPIGFVELKQRLHFE